LKAQKRKNERSANKRGEKDRLNAERLKAERQRGLEAEERSPTHAHSQDSLEAETPAVIQSHTSAVPKTVILAATVASFVLMMIIGAIWFDRSQLNPGNREPNRGTLTRTPESNPMPLPARTVSQPPTSINPGRSFEYAELHRIDDLDFYKIRDYDRAISEYTEAIESDPSNDFANASMYYYRGLAYRNKNEYDKAIRDFNRVILLNPMKANAYYYRGLAYYHKNEYDKAIQDFSEAIILDPSDPTAYYYRGVIYGQQGKDAEAQADFEQSKLLGDQPLGIGSP
jgi:tetratricopeptide (TPR) repeat protein